MAEEELDTNAILCTDEVKKGAIQNTSCFPHLQKAPWLLYLIEGSETGNGISFSVENKQSYLNCIPQLAGNVCHVISHGWILFEDCKNEKLCLLNPTSMEIVDNIPPPPPLPTLEQRRPSICWYKITAPPTDEKCILLITRDFCPHIQVYYLREKKWIVKQVCMTEADSIQQVVTVNDEVFGITYNGHFGNLHLEHEKPTMEYLNKIPYDPVCESTYEFCMFVSEGELYLVVTVEQLWTGVVEKLAIFKLNFSEMRWEEVNNIGDHVFFLDFNWQSGGITCGADNMYLRKNQIYYVRDNNVYQYNVATRGIAKLQSFSYLGEDIYCYWVLPKSMNIDEGMKTLEDEQRTQRCTRSWMECASNDSYGEIRGKTKVINTGESESQETQLPKVLPEIVPIILNHLSYFDSECLGCAFPDWLPIIRETPKPHNYMNPPCFISFTNDYRSCCLVDPLRGMRGLIQSPPELPCSLKILCSKQGWLLLMTTNNDLTKTDSLPTQIFFYNPLSKAIIQLPPGDFKNKIFSFSSTPTSKGCVVVAAHMSTYRRGKMIICCKGDTCWTEIDGGFRHNLEGFETLYTHAVFVKGKFHFLSKDGRIGLFDPVARSWNVPRQKRVKPKNSRHYLIESNDEIFRVRASNHGFGIDVHKLDRSNYIWKEAESLEGMCFFLWPNSSISASASDSSKNKEEKVYLPMLQDGQFVHYSYGKNKLFPEGNFLYAVELLYGSCWIQPCWVQHTDEELRWY